MRLGTIVEHLQAMSRGDLEGRIHVRRLTIQMHRQDDLCPRCDRRFQLFRIDVVGGFDGLDRHYPRSAMRDRRPGGYVRVRRNNDLVTRTDAQRKQRRVQCIESAGGVPRKASRSDIGL